jgi:DNA-3-methyladenine glycosylase II
MEKQAVAHLSSADPRLAGIIRRVGRCTMRRDGDPFQSLVGAIMYQQLAGSAADAIYARFMKLYENRFPTPARLLATTATANEGSLLRAVGLSGRKIEYMKDLAQRVHDGRLDLAGLASLGDDEVIERLTEVKGIGRWTAEMFLIFCLGRPDVLPVGDLGLQKAMKVAYSLRALPAPARMQKIAEPWRPYRSVATWYMWKSLEKFKAIG